MLERETLPSFPKSGWAIFADTQKNGGLARNQGAIYPDLYEEVI